VLLLSFSSDRLTLHCVEFIYSPKRPDRLWGPTQPHVEWLQGLFLRVNRPEREVNDPPTSSAKCKNWGSQEWTNCVEFIYSPKRPDRLWGPTQPHVEWLQGLFLGVNRPACEVNDPPTSSAKCKNWGSQEWTNFPKIDEPEGARKVTCSKHRTEGSQMLGATVGFVHPWVELSVCSPFVACVGTALPSPVFLKK
jgi:hypothetical protein